MIINKKHPSISTAKEVRNTEEAIMEAAEEEFLTKGFALSKTTEIANRAGVTHAMLHYYFRTKENIFEKVLEKKVQQVGASLLKIIEGDLPFLEKIEAGIKAHFDFIAQDPRLSFFVLNEFLLNPQRLADYRHIVMPVIKRVCKAIRKGIEEEIPKGSLRPIAPEHLIYDIICLNVGVFLVLPVFKKTANIPSEELSAFLESRKKENVETILRRIKP